MGLWAHNPAMSVRAAIIALYGLVAAGFLSASRLVDGVWSEAFLGYGFGSATPASVRARRASAR